MITYADIIVDLQAGDTGKGKVCHSLLKKEDEYNYVIRYNGGGNAGHTIYHNGQKIVTHFIPCGVLYGIKSIIGPGCVVNVSKLFSEIEYLENFGFNVRENLLIDKRAHIITDEHLELDGQDNKIGTTKQGIGPAYQDKYGRKGIRVESEPLLSDFIFDIYSLHKDKNAKILFEGAQGFELDVDWGDYPYVTSSHCTSGSAILNGVPPQSIRKIFGTAKAYRTYVGLKEFEDSTLEVFEKIREIGQEYGATTGRKRQVNWIDVSSLIQAININGVTDLIINKLDVLESVGEFKLIYDSEIMSFEKISEFKSFIKIISKLECPLLKEITFSKSPLSI